MPGLRREQILRNRKPDASTAGAVAAICVASLLFAFIAIAVQRGETQSIDRGILLAFRRPDGSLTGSPAVQQAARDLTALGSSLILWVLTLLSAGFLALQRKGRLALLLLVSIASGAVSDYALKGLFQRARPELVPHLVFASGASFPSGHSMMSALTYLTLGALFAHTERRTVLKIYVLAAAIFLTAMVGLTRIYLGVHWPSDVLAGWSAGVVWAVLSWLAAKRLQRERSKASARRNIFSSSK